MMGNDSSQLSGLEIEDKPADITDFWAQYQATIKDSCRYFSFKSDGSVSVFKGEAVLGPLWTTSTPLEKFSNNLLKYRHPCIVRYISAWQQRSTLHLATEYVQPLSQILNLQNPLQICIGLNNILRALVFLHEQAGMSHNNISLSAIYVTGDGQWKLGGLQYLCAFTELTSAYLKHARIHRYDKAIDPNEESCAMITKIDQYAFAVLVDDVFKGCKDDDVPHLSEFKKFCHKSLQNSDSTKRPSLSEALQHSFFNHEFISIYKFLNFLPLKSDEEKSHFFSKILESLKCYDEETVAKQLSGLLLSRLTMLDETARKNVIPFIFKPNNERVQNENAGFFSLTVFKEHLKPRILQLFGVRDSQIRLLLLTHFSKFVHVFTHEELSQHILPEILLGIKDTDDNLVAATLICLSELVPLLGADTVVGGKRSKLFTDGRPNSKNSGNSYSACRMSGINMSLPSKSLHEFSCSENVFNGSNNSLNERPSPVGGEAIDEDIKTIETSISKHIVSEDDWSDWENSNQNIHSTKKSNNIIIMTNSERESESTSDSAFKFNEVSPSEMNLKSDKTALLHKAALEAKKNMVDISDLDIKNQKFDYSKKTGDEFDFFADMTPVIEKPTLTTALSQVHSMDLSSKLNFVPEHGDDENEGWSDN